MGCSCNKTPCTCSPSPFYTQAPMCQEDNTCYVNTSSYKFSVCPTNSWNIPACGFSAILNIQGLESITVGAFLWEPNYGYFEINSVDADNGTIGIVNNCTSGNADPGVQVPMCTCFVQVDTPPTDVNANCDLLAIDFTAPAEGDCIDISLLSVNGLIAGNNVQIESGVYSLSAIKANEIITICNEGEGLPAGTAVIAKDVTGKYVVCVTLLSINPCGTDPVSAGPVMVCSEGVGATLSGTTNGDILTLQDNTTGAGAYQTPATIPAIITITNDITTINTEITTINAAIAALSSGIATNTSTNKTGTATFGNPVVGNAASVTVINPSTTQAESVIFSLTFYVDGNLTNGKTNWGSIALTPIIDFNGGGPTNVNIETIEINLGTDASTEISKNITLSFVTSIAASGNYNLQASLTTAVITVGGPTYAITNQSTKIDVLGVAV